MADGVTFTVDRLLFDRWLAEKLIRMPQTAVTVVEEVGRQAQTAARTHAPVLSGALRDSIQVERQTGARVSVSPTGKARLYATKEEARSGFMAAGLRAAEAAAVRVAVEQFGKVWVG